MELDNSYKVEPELANILAIVESKSLSDHNIYKDKRRSNEWCPPKNSDEFLDYMNINEWPDHLGSENCLDCSEEDILGFDDNTLKQLLQKECPINLTPFDEFGERMGHLAEVLSKYADLTVCFPSCNDVIQEINSKATERSNENSVRDNPAFQIYENSSSRKNLGTGSSYSFKLEDRQRGLVKSHAYPGFSVLELTELPNGLEAPHILHRVTISMKLKPGFEVFWKKAFLSPASVAMLQDTFWWFFITTFEVRKEKFEKDRDAIYDRISDSFVALFTSIHPDMKDKFLQLYPEALAKSVYASFHEAFPQSHDLFDDTFKQALLNAMFEWITGSSSPIGLHKEWIISDLEPGYMKDNGSGDKMQKDAPDENLLLDMEDFYQTIDRLSDDVTHTSVGQPEIKQTQKTCVAEKKSTWNLTESPAYSSIPGADFRRVLFRIQGHSPLVMHYLHMRNLHDGNQRGRYMKRTELFKSAPECSTYSSVIRQSQHNAKERKERLLMVHKTTEKEIAKIEQRSRRIMSLIKNLETKLSVTSNPVERNNIVHCAKQILPPDCDTPRPISMMASKESTFGFSEDDEEWHD